MHAVVVAGGHVPRRDALDRAWPGWSDEIALVVGADAGAIAAEALGLRLDLVVGDADSAGESTLERLSSTGVEVRRSPRAKDETDTELAILAAVEAGADRLTLLGALGGARLDHELANVELLAHPALRGRNVVMLDADVRVSLLQGPAADGAPARADIHGVPGTVVSLLALGDDVHGVTTENLLYPLRDESLPLGPARGISNVLTASAAVVTLRAGRLLIVELTHGP